MASGVVWHVQNGPSDADPARQERSPAWSWRARLGVWARLLRLHRPIGTLLLLWPTLWALMLAAGGWPGWYPLLAFSLGTLLMRSAGCAINDYADRNFDGAVARTRERPLATGEARPVEALVLFVLLSVMALPLILPFGWLTWVLAGVAAFLAGSYPFFKRFFPMPQAYLGIAFGFGIPMAFAALRGEVPATAWILLAANVCWAVAYDTEYAMVDREDDLKLGLRSSAITFGRHDVRAVMVCYGATILLLAWAAAREALLPWVLPGLLGAGGVALYHHTLIRGRSRDGCFQAFNHNNWFGLFVAAGFAMALLAIRLPD